MLMVLYHAPASNGPNLDDELLLLMMTVFVVVSASPTTFAVEVCAYFSSIPTPSNSLTPLSIAPPS